MSPPSHFTNSACAVAAWQRLCAYLSARSRLTNTPDSGPDRTALTNAVLNGLGQLSFSLNSVNCTEVDELPIVVISKYDQQAALDSLPSTEKLPIYEEPSLLSETPVSTGTKPLAEQAIESDTQWWEAYKAKYKVILLEDRRKVESLLSGGMEAIRQAQCDDRSIRILTDLLTRANRHDPPITVSEVHCTQHRSSSNQTVISDSLFSADTSADCDTGLCAESGDTATGEARGPRISSVSAAASAGTSVTTPSHVSRLSSDVQTGVRLSSEEQGPLHSVTDEELSAYEARLVVPWEQAVDSESSAQQECGLRLAVPPAYGELLPALKMTELECRVVAQPSRSSVLCNLVPTSSGEEIQPDGLDNDPLVEEGKLPRGRAMQRLLLRLKLLDGILYYQISPSSLRGRSSIEYVLCIPTAYRDSCIRLAHGEDVLSHHGVTKTLGLLKRRYYWPGMHRSISRVVSECLACQKYKNPLSNIVYHIGTLPKSGPWHTIGVDFFGPLPKSQLGYQYVLVVLGHFTK
eukprot:GHVQ01009856.1.p1 GENE.GHVQ01009856.1~~GHVQ01009856.1.p1  ORF type:complete len:596 (+),score=50.87 GHVQ01009856.1:232-1788(+)